MEEGGVALLRYMRCEIGSHPFANSLPPGIFLDLKLADTWGTCKNTIMHYKNCPPDILTVRESVGVQAFYELQKNFPEMEIALVSALTDIPEAEIVARYGQTPWMKIANDIERIEAEYKKYLEWVHSSTVNKPFSMVVCSPLEVQALDSLFAGRYQFIVPGIRDAWMLKGQQARSTGIRQALNSGATYVVVGAQMTQGSPRKGVSVEESRTMTLREVVRSSRVVVEPNNPLQTLVNCTGFYQSRCDADGKIVGPLVGYAGKDETGKNFVGACYINLATVEERPRVLAHFARTLAENIKGIIGDDCVDVFLGAPMGGLLLAGALSQEMNVRTAFAEKKVKALSDSTTGVKEESELVISRHTINKGDRVIIVEDLCNNFSTTSKLVNLIETLGGVVVGIACILNRSPGCIWLELPVMSVIHKPLPQYRQDDPEVAHLVRDGNVVWKPKYEWSKLLATMQKK